MLGLFLSVYTFGTFVIKMSFFVSSLVVIVLVVVFVFMLSV